MKRLDAEETSEDTVDAELGGGKGLARGRTLMPAWTRMEVCKFQAINPETSRFLEVWDFLFLLVLAVIAVVTPLEAAFSLVGEEFCHAGVRFAADGILLLDMLAQSLIAFPDKRCPSRYVKDPRKIAINYLKSYFFVDLASSLPYHVLDGGAFPQVRLVRMLRLHAVSPILARRQVRIGVSHAMLSLLKFLFGLSFTCHWMACTWAGVAFSVDDKHTWLKALEAAKSGPRSMYQTISGVYCLALYWAIMTLTSIGYGDITPQSQKEYWVACFCMIAMATVWAFVIGQMCAVVATLLPHDVAFKRTMDDLNWLLKDSQMPEPLRMKLRRYFYESRSLCRLHEQKAIIAQMSPMLQGEVSEQLLDDWIDKVPYVKAVKVSCSDNLAQVARKLKPMLYAPTEAIECDRSLHIVRRGVCMRGGRILVTGDVWGIDMILSNELLRDTSQVRSLSYLEVLGLRYVDLRDSVTAPEGRASIRRWQIRLGVGRGLALVASEIRNWEKRSQSLFSGLPQSARMMMATSILRGSFSGHAPQPAELRKGTRTLSLSSFSTAQSSRVVEANPDKAEEVAATAAGSDLEDVKTSLATLTQAVESLQQMVQELHA